jgi:drug/metabolite transporter (DMT)-like permease
VSEAPPGPAVTTRVWLPFLIVTLIWGSTWIVITGQLGVVPAAWSVAYRFALASATMFAFAAARRVRLRLGMRDLALLAVIGIAQFALNFNFVYRAEQHVTSGLVAVVFALLIVPNAVFGRIFLGQGLSRPFLLGSLVALAGMALLFEHEMAMGTRPPAAVVTGIALTLSGVFCASIANVLQATELARRLPMPALLGWAMLFGSLIDAAFAWATSGPPVFDPRPAYIAGLLYLGVIASAIAFTLYFNLIRAIGPARAAYTSVLIPVLAMTFSTLFENYVWAWESAIGGLLVLGGLVIALRARNPAR